MDRLDFLALPTPQCLDGVRLFLDDQGNIPLPQDLPEPGLLLHRDLERQAICEAVSTALLAQGRSECIPGGFRKHEDLQDEKQGKERLESKRKTPLHWVIIE